MLLYFGRSTLPPLKQHPCTATAPFTFSPRQLCRSSTHVPARCTYYVYVVQVHTKSSSHPMSAELPHSPEDMSRPPPNWLTSSTALTRSLIIAVEVAPPPVIHCAPQSPQLTTCQHSPVSGCRHRLWNSFCSALSFHSQSQRSTSTLQLSTHRRDSPATLCYCRRLYVHA